AAIGDDVAGESPLLAKRIAQFLVGAAGFAIGAVVSAHDGGGFAVDNGGFESGQIGFLQVAFGGGGVKAVTRRLRTAVDREVFWRRDYFEITGIVPLQSLDEGDAEARGKIGIFAVGFLAAAPARVAKDVDIRAPEGKPFVTGVLAVSEEFVVFSASLGRDDVGDLV